MTGRYTTPQQATYPLFGADSLREHLGAHLRTVTQALGGRIGNLEHILRDPVADVAALLQDGQRRPMALINSMFAYRSPKRHNAAVQRVLALALCRVAEAGASSADALTHSVLPVGAIGSATFGVTPEGVVVWGYGGGWAREGVEEVTHWAHDAAAACFYLVNAFSERHGRVATVDAALAWALSDATAHPWPEDGTSAQRATVILPWLEARFVPWFGARK